MHTNARKSLSRMEAEIGQPLRDFLLEHYDQDGLSFREISQWLALQGVSVSHCTLYRWYYHLCGYPRSIREAMRHQQTPLGGISLHFT